MSPRDEDRDAWLAQALRHAPDANADAPPALSAAILREARAAAPRPAAARAAPALESRGPLQWLASVGAWLARPPVAAGFASVMVATLVGVMWWDQPLDATLPREPEVVSSTPQARADVVPPAVPPAVVAAAPQATPAEAAAPRPAEIAARGRLADKKEAAKKESETRDAETSARVSRPAVELPRQRAEADTAPAVAAAAPPPAAFPAAPPAPAPRAATTANEAPAPFAERRERAAPAAKAAAELSAPATTAADSATSPRDALRASQGAASPALAKARVAGAGDAPLAALRAGIAPQPERWRWQRGAGAPQPMTPALQAWLATAEASTGALWRVDADGTPREPANSVRLLRDSVLQATLGFSGNALWVEAAGASSSAALSASEAGSLRQALDAATP